MCLNPDFYMLRKTYNMTNFEKIRIFGNKINLEFLNYSQNALLLLFIFTLVLLQPVENVSLVFSDL